MRRVFVWVLAGITAVGAVSAYAQDDRKKGTFQAQRAGWMLGMYVGEEKGYPFPFVLELDAKSEAKAKGLRAGDELIRLENDEVTSLTRLFDQVGRFRSGRIVTLWARRGAQSMRYELRVPKDPTAKGEAEAKKDKEKEGEESADGQEKDKKKKKKKKAPITVKPIPPPSEP